ncbi:glycosyltransferase family 2 protein [Rudaea sp.]|uniref:glycosyltransferase family 2 protein n=1 Tax=Rudaea sp. TaxID=2136325 RepID=UPI003784740B
MPLRSVAGIASCAYRGKTMGWRQCTTRGARQGRLHRRSSVRFSAMMPCSSVRAAGSRLSMILTIAHQWRSNMPGATGYRRVPFRVLVGGAAMTAICGMLDVKADQEGNEAYEPAAERIRTDTRDGGGRRQPAALFSTTESIAGAASDTGHDRLAEEPIRTRWSAGANVPLVSVIVPTFNRAHLIGRTLRSVLAQSYPALEVIVVDDGSTDDTRATIARDYADDARVRYVYKQNGGPASARNIGFAQSRGEYVALLDSDDTWFPWKLALQVGCMERDRSLGMTWTDMVMVDADGKIIDPAYLRHMYHAYRSFPEEQMFERSLPLADIAPELASVTGTARLRTGCLFSKMIMGNLVHTSTVVLRRERLDRVVGFNESLRHSGEDYDFHLRTCREGPVGLLDLPAIRYQQGLPDQLTASRYRIHMAENLLRTIEPVVRENRAQIDLPEHMIRRKLAQTHAWVASERLERGESALAISHYLKSLGYWPWQPGLAKPLLIASLPFGSGLLLRDRVRALRERLHGNAEGKS